MTEKTKHNQVKIHNPFRNELMEVDEGMAELLPLLWANDIKTIMSCQENKPGYAWIMFYELEDIRKFLVLVSKSQTLLFDRMERKSGTKDMWRYEIIPCGEEVLFPITGFTGRSYKFLYSVRFPVSDIAELVSIFKGKDDGK